MARSTIRSISANLFTFRHNGRLLRKGISARNLQYDPEPKHQVRVVVYWYVASVEAGRGV